MQQIFMKQIIIITPVTEYFLNLKYPYIFQHGTLPKVKQSSDIHKSDVSGSIPDSEIDKLYYLKKKTNINNHKNRQRKHNTLFLVVGTKITVK